MPRGAARKATINLGPEVDKAGHGDDEARLRQLGYKQELVGRRHVFFYWAIETRRNPAAWGRRGWQYCN